MERDLLDLRSRIATTIGNDAVESVLEYLSTFNVRKEEDNEVRKYLHELLGKSKETDAIVNDYISHVIGKRSSNPIQKQKAFAEKSQCKPSRKANNYSESHKPTKLGGRHSDGSTSLSALMRYASGAHPSSAQSCEGAINRKICGCLGTRHRYIGSCLSCGRVCCEAEGLGLCPHCNDVDKGTNMIPPLASDEVAGISGVDEETIVAYKHKDKLLLFDRENAKRTHVHDAQADYYETGTWLSEEEKAEIEEKERQRRDKMRPSNRKYRISFDIAGRRIVEAVDPTDDEDNDGEISNAGNKPLEESSVSAAQKQTKKKERFVEGELSSTDHAVFLGANNEQMHLHTVVENSSLSASTGKAGEVYRLLRNSMAERVLKSSAVSVQGRDGAASVATTATADPEEHLPSRKTDWKLPRVDLNFLDE